MIREIKHLLVTLGFLCIPFVVTGQQNENVSTIDLEPHKGWNFTGALAMRPDERFTLMIMISGKKDDCVEFDALEAVRMSHDRPGSPRLSTPVHGIALSPVALHFCWFAETNAIAYEIQVSQQQDFSNAKSFQLEPPYLTDRISYLPMDNELLSMGKWYWRVRGMNINEVYGPWSEPGTFLIREQTLQPQSPVLSISSSHPLIILFSDELNLVTNWNSLPDELKPYTVFRVEALPSENLFRVARKADENNIPVIIQLSGPHDDYGRMAARITLSEAELILQEYNAVKGFYICEQAFRVFPPRNRIMMDYARRLIQLSAAYGRSVVWADGHWGRNLWIDVGLNKELISTIQENSAYFVPLWKMNCSLTTYSIQSALLGLWLGQVVDNWGIQPEHWYWYEAGFGKPGQQQWFKEGVMNEFPTVFYGQMMLLGLSGGASVYSFEPSDDSWDKEGHPSDISRKITFPLLSVMIRDSLISDRSEIRKKVRLVHVAHESDSHWDLDYGTLQHLYKSMYGTGQPFQVIPSSIQNYYLPVFSRWTQPSVLESFSGLEDNSVIGRNRSIEDYLHENRVNSYNGDAWAVVLDKAVLVMNNKENQDIDQSFDVSLNGNVHRISGILSMNSYLLAYRSGDAFTVNVNGRAGKNMILKLYSNNKPVQITVTPEEFLTSQDWLNSEGCLHLEFRLTQQTTKMEVLFSEK